MTVSAAGTFTVTSCQEDTYTELGGSEKITKAQMGFRLAGDLAGLAGSGISVAAAGQPAGTYSLDYELD